MLGAHTRPAAMHIIPIALTWISAVAAARTRDSFRVFWNVPSFSCHKYGLLYNVSSSWGFVQNIRDNFRGEQIAILYDPGKFPALIKTSGGKVYVRNGGAPQEGNLTDHLQALSRDVDRFIVDRNFSGLGIVDMESWRPIFRQLFGTFTPYKEFSYDIERKRHPLWNQFQVYTTAKDRFEDAARVFMESSLELVRQKRPLGQWGYYAFPYCFNWDKPNCHKQVQIENDRLQWLFEESRAIYPSIYLGEKQDPLTRKDFIQGRLLEARRMAQRTMRLQEPEVFAYVRYNYHDTGRFLSYEDIYNSFTVPKDLHLSGIIVWGSSNDVNTRKKCEGLQRYVDNVLGPLTRNVTEISNNP